MNEQCDKTEKKASRRIIQATIDIDLETFELTAIRALGETFEENERVCNVIAQRFA